MPTLTSAAEVGFHRTREVEYIGTYEDEARYVELLADFAGDFPDLTEEPHHPALEPEPTVGYPQSQALALALRREGYRGLLYPSVRHRGGRCFVAFDLGIIQSVRPGASWRFIWKGSPSTLFTPSSRLPPILAMPALGLRSLFSNGFPPDLGRESARP